MMQGKARQNVKDAVSALLRRARALAGSERFRIGLALLLPTIVVWMIVDQELQFGDTVTFGMIQLEMVFTAFAPAVFYYGRSLRRSSGKTFHWIDAYWFPFALIVLVDVLAIALAITH